MHAKYLIRSREKLPRSKRMSKESCRKSGHGQIFAAGVRRVRSLGSPREAPFARVPVFHTVRFVPMRYGVFTCTSNCFEVRQESCTAILRELPFVRRRRNTGNGVHNRLRKCFGAYRAFTGCLPGPGARSSQAGVERARAQSPVSGLHKRHMHPRGGPPLGHGPGDHSRFHR
jgi:hypothetical protein